MVKIPYKIISSHTLLWNCSMISAEKTVKSTLRSTSECMSTQFSAEPVDFQILQKIVLPTVTVNVTVHQRGKVKRRVRRPQDHHTSAQGTFVCRDAVTFTSGCEVSFRLTGLNTITHTSQIHCRWQSCRKTGRVSICWFKKGAARWCRW